MQPKEVELNLKYHTIGTNLEPVCTTYLNVPSELQKASVLLCFVFSQKLKTWKCIMSL